jgi:hypothetical protein
MNLSQPFQSIFFVCEGWRSVYQRQKIERAAQDEVALPVERNDVIAVIENDSVHETSQVILEVLKVAQTRAVVVSGMNDESSLTDAPQFALHRSDKPSQL